MTKELIEGTPKDGCGEGLCTACAAHDFTPSLGAVREAQRGLANAHITGDEVVAAFDRMIEKHVADALAAVPDAATEEPRPDELTANEAIELVLKRPGMYGLTRTDEFRKVEAERDAALAAVERVRAIDTGNNRALYGNDFEAGMAKALWLVKTGLDGAPEPEEKP